MLSGVTVQEEKYKEGCVLLQYSLVCLVDAEGDSDVDCPCEVGTLAPQRSVAVHC